MRNEQATAIKKAMSMVGVGLLEAALLSEAGKGCSPTMCVSPVDLEPPYRVFDGHTVLGRRDGEVAWPEPTRDRAFATYQIYAAEEDILALDWQEALLRGLAVFSGPMAYELTGNREGVHLRFVVPREEERGVLAALTGIFPALRLRSVGRPFAGHDPSLPFVVEELVPVPPYHRTLSLIRREGVSPLGIAYRALEQLTSDELGVYQVLLKPTAPENDWHFNISSLAEAERRAEESRLLGGLSSDFAYDHDLPAHLDQSVVKKVQVDCATYALICRYAAWAEPGRASAFTSTMRAATGVLRFGNRAFRRLENKVIVTCLGERDSLRMVTRRRAHRPGLVLTSHEVASFFHLPNDRTLKMFRVVERRDGVEWDEGAAPRVERGDILIGVNEFAGAATPVIIPRAVRLQHWHMVGRTGTGKSYLMLGAMLVDAKTGQGFCLIDPHGDLVDGLLSRLPEESLSKLVVVSFRDPELAPVWNPFLSKVSPGKFADDFVRAFTATTDHVGPRMQNIILNAAYAVHALRGCIGDFASILSFSEAGRALRVRALESIDNPEVLRFFQEEFTSYSGTQLDSVKNKFSRFLLHDSLGTMFRNPENEIDPRAWMDEGKIVVVDLSAGIIGSANAAFLGGLLCSLFHRAALSRAEIPREQRRPFFLYLDECQQFQSGALDEMLSEARKFGLGLSLSHQAMGQLQPPVARAVGNCGTLTVFQPVEDDIVNARRALMGRVDDERLLRLGTGEAYVAMGSRVANVKTTDLGCEVLRDGAQLVREIANRTHIRVGKEPSRQGLGHKRRERVFDTFGGKGHSDER